MAHFRLVSTTPVLPAYLFEADLVVSIVPPQTYTVVPTSDGEVYIHWSKDTETSDPYNDLYTEIYRSIDLESWTLIATRQWLNYDYYNDDTVTNNKIYYYKARFVRKDALSVVTNTSDYTAPIAAKTVNLLGFEPRDTYSNKFFKYLIDALPGTRIYDHTTAAHFSSNDYHLWQTTCKILDGFNVYVNGSVADTQPVDMTALYSKRQISFMLDKAHSTLTSTELSTGAAGELVHVNSYLIYTFLMGYAIQFMNLYETYLGIVANKFIDYSQVYTKGFKPAVSDQKDTSLAELYYSFGTLFGLEPLKYGELDQGLVQYKNFLKNSFTNQDSLGKVKAIGDACSNALGITTETLLEYYKQHFFKSDREHKLYVVPASADPYEMYVNSSGSNNDLKYTLTDNRNWAMVRYLANAVHTSGSLDVYGSGPDTPNMYLFDVHVSDGYTTADDVKMWLAPYSSILTVGNSSGSTGAGVIDTNLAGVASQLIRVHSKWVGWENTLLTMYGDTLQVNDTMAALETSEDTCNVSRMITDKDPTVNIGPKGDTSFPAAGTYTDTGLADLESNDLVIAKDTNSVGVSYFKDPLLTPSVTVYGDKKVLFKLNLTVSRMQWVTRATLKIFVTKSTDAGYLRLYRVKKSYNSNNVCWNYRDKSISNGYEWDNSTYTYTAAANSTWVTEDWELDGASGDTDNVFLKEFFLDKVDSPTWVSMDVTDIIKDLYKYEASRLDMGEDPQNLLQTGFMLTAEDYPERSLVVIKGHSDTTFKPKMLWERLPTGFYQVAPSETRYFYIDGTTRYGRLLVMSDTREPISYIKTVNERIRAQDIRFTSDVSVRLTTTPPAGFVAGAVVYDVTNGAVGTISSTKNNYIYVSMSISNFAAGDTIKVLPNGLTATIDSGDAVSYVGNKYVVLSRTPVSSSILRVLHTGVTTTPATPPADYPAYTAWTEGGSGVEPYFVSATSGVSNIFATQDTTELNKVYLNSSDQVSAIGDVIVTYQYQYDFVMLGRAVADSDSVSSIEGCNRLGVGLFSQRENDYLYSGELMLPMGSTGTYEDMTTPSQTAYSEHNMNVLCQAVANIRRYNGKVDVFKYGIEAKPYRFGQLYHTFLKGA